MATQTYVLETIYSAALEREWIRSQQRSAVGISPATDEPKENLSKDLRGYLSNHPGWWTTQQLADATAIDKRLVISRLNTLVYAGKVRRAYPAIKGSVICRGFVQRYQWSGGN